MNIVNECIDKYVKDFVSPDDMAELDLVLKQLCDNNSCENDIEHFAVCNDSQSYFILQDTVEVDKFVEEGQRAF